MTIKDLAEVQSEGVEIRVVEPDAESKVVKASFNSKYSSIVTEEFLSQEISSMTVKKTDGQSVYIEIMVAKNNPDDTAGNDTDSSGD